MLVSLFPLVVIKLKVLKDIIDLKDLKSDKKTVKKANRKPVKVWAKPASSPQGLGLKGPLELFLASLETLIA